MHLLYSTCAFATKKIFLAQIKQLIKLIKIPFCFYQSDENWLYSNVFDHYFTNGHYFSPPKTLFFTFSPRRRQRRRQQYEVFQKIFYETSLSNTKMTLPTTSVRNNRMFQPIGTRHSTFTFCPVFTPFWPQWRYPPHIWDQNLPKTWKIVDKWRFWSMITSSEFLLVKLIGWWSIDDQKVDR
jgi:hypothetical protein